MEIYPVEWPRLSGDLWYGPPHLWRTSDTQYTLEVLPAPIPYGFIGFFILLALLEVVGVWMALKTLPYLHDSDWGQAASIGVALALILCSLLVYLAFVREQSRGPILVVSLKTRELSLPREAKSWTFDRVVRLEIVHGTSQRIERRRFRPFDEISELQLVVTNGGGEWSAWPIVGALGKSDPTLYSAANTIAKKLEVPLLVTAGGEKVVGNSATAIC
jgi:hypothetical protein